MTCNNDCQVFNSCETSPATWHAPGPAVPPRCLSCPASISYWNTLYTHVVHRSGDITKFQDSSRYIWQQKSNLRTFPYTGKWLSGRVPWHLGMTDRVCVFVHATEPVAPPPFFIICFGPLGLGYISTGWQSNHCQGEHQKWQEDIWKSNVIYSAGRRLNWASGLRWISQTDISKINQVIMEEDCGGALHFHPFRMGESTRRTWWGRQAGRKK